MTISWWADSYWSREGLSRLEDQTPAVISVDHGRGWVLDHKERWFSPCTNVGQTVLKAGGEHQRKKPKNTITQIQDHKISDEIYAPGR